MRRTTKSASRPLNLFVCDALAGVELSQSGLNLREEDKTLNRIVERCIWRQLLHGLANLLPRSGFVRLTVAFTSGRSGFTAGPSGATRCYAVRR